MKELQDTTNKLYDDIIPIKTKMKKYEKVGDMQLYTRDHIEFNPENDKKNKEIYDKLNILEIESDSQLKEMMIRMVNIHKYMWT